MKYAVLRDCCTSGNCDQCAFGVTPYGKCLTVCQTMPGGVDKDKAEVIAKNWKDYNARVATLEEAVLAQDETDRLKATARRKREVLNRHFVENAK